MVSTSRCVSSDGRPATGGVKLPQIRPACGSKRMPKSTPVMKASIHAPPRLFSRGDVVLNKVGFPQPGEVVEEIDQRVAQHQISLCGKRFARKTSNRAEIFRYGYHKIAAIQAARPSACDMLAVSRRVFPGEG